MHRFPISLLKVCSIDEKHGVSDIVFLPQFSQQPLGHRRRNRCKEPQLQEFDRLGIDSSVPSELLAVDAAHRLVERDVIRTRVVGGL